jgi:hypothetical protein
MRGRGIGSYRLGDRYVTPDRKMSEMLTQQGSRGGPSNSWQETMGRIAQQLAGAYIGYKDQKNQNVANQAFTKAEPDSYSMKPTYSPAETQEFLQQATGGISNELRPTDKAEAMLDTLQAPMLQGTAPSQIQEETFGPQGQRPEQPNIDGSGWNQMPDLSRVHETNTYANVPNPNPAQQTADLMANNQTETMNEKKPQLEYAMQNLRGLENNPYAQRLLQGLMMNQMDTNAASRLAGTARDQQLADATRDRGYAVEDATTDFGRKKELANIAIEGKKTKEQRNWEMAQDDPKFSAFLSVTGAGNTPNAVKEYQYYMGLKTEPERQNFMNIKRATKTMNLGDTVKVLDPTNPSGAPLTSYQKGIPPQQTVEHKSNVKGGQTLAKETAEAKFNLPKILATANRHLDLLDRVTKVDPETGKRINHEGFQSLYGTAIPVVDGMSVPFQRFIPGTKAKDLSAIVEQIGGSNFLLAFESLKGGGQITENEGNQAKLAISALQDINISEEEAVSQYDTLRKILATGVENAKTEAGQYDMQLTNTGNTGNQSRRSTDKQERRATDIPEGVSKEQWGVMSPEQKALFK